MVSLTGSSTYAKGTNTAGRVDARVKCYGMPSFCRSSTLVEFHAAVSTKEVEEAPALSRLLTKYSNCFTAGLLPTVSVCNVHDSGEHSTELLRQTANALNLTDDEIKILDGRVQFEIEPARLFYAFAKITKSDMHAISYFRQRLTPAELVFHQDAYSNMTELADLIRDFMGVQILPGTSRGLAMKGPGPVTEKGYGQVPGPLQDIASCSGSVAALVRMLTCWYIFLPKTDPLVEITEAITLLE